MDEDDIDNLYLAEVQIRGKRFKRTLLEEWVAAEKRDDEFFGLDRDTPAHRFSEEYKAPPEDTNERILRELEGISDGIQKIAGILQEARSQKDSKKGSQQAVGSVHPEADNALAGKGAEGDEGFR